MRKYVTSKAPTSIFERVLNEPVIDILKYYLKTKTVLNKPWKHNIKRNVNSDFSIVTMRRVAIIFFELGVVKHFMQKF